MNAVKSNAMILLLIIAVLFLLGINSRASEYYSWPAYNPTVAYDYQNEFGKINPPTQVLNDVTGVVGTYTDGWCCFRWGANKNSLVTEADWIPMIQRLNDDFAYITNVMRWPRDKRAREGYYSTVYLYGSGLSTDSASNTETGGWQGTTWYNGQAWPMILASYFPVHCFDPAYTGGDKGYQTGAMVHEGIHCILSSMPGCTSAAWFHEGGNTWLQGTMEAQRSGNFSGLGWLSVGAAIAPFMPIECYTGWLQDDTFGGPSAEGVNMFNGDQQICTWRNLLGGTQYGECFPHAMEVILGPKSIAWVWRNSSLSGRVLQDLAEAPNGLGPVQTRRLIQEYRARQAFCDFGPWSYAFRQLLNNNWNVVIDQEWSPYWIDCATWNATCYASTTQSGSVLTPETRTLPGWSGANQIPLTVNSSATEASVTFNPIGANMSCQLVYRDTSGNIRYGVPVSSGACSIPLANVRNNVVVAVICNTDYIYYGETTRTAKYNYTLTLGAGVTGKANIYTKWYDYNPASYTITASAGANGTISPSGAVSVTAGASRTFTFTANSGYLVDKIILNGLPIGVLSSYTFNNVRGNYTISATFRANESNPPAAPTNLTANASGSRITLDWADNAEDDLASYTVYRRTAGGSYKAIAAGITASAYTDKAAANGITYYYAVTAVDTTDFESAYSSETAGVGGPDIVAYYELEGGATDSSGNGNNAAASGAPAYTTGHIGQAIVLNGSNNLIALPANIAVSNDITVTTWVYWDSGSAWQRIFDFGNNTSQYLFLTPYTGGVMRFAIKNGGSEQTLDTTTLTVGQWVHIAVTLSGNTGKLYVNGQLKTTNTAMTINPSDFNPANNYIGKSQFSDPLFDGRIDDFRIYNYALSAAQVVVVFSGNTAPTFTSDPINNLGAVELFPYSGNSLVTYTNDADGIGSVAFSKVSGPTWLVVAGDGTLSGVPCNTDVGANVFTVKALDNGGLSDTAVMNIQVANIYSGVEGLNDLIGLSAEWLGMGCTDVPACGGADLDGDADVDLSDFAKLAFIWLAVEDIEIYLKLNETNGIIAHDSSLFDRSGTLNNGPTWSTAGHSGGALSFDGVDDYVVVSDYKGIAAMASRTCSAWIKTGGSSTNMVIMDWGIAAAGQKWLFGIFTTGNLTVYTWSPYIQTDVAVTDNQWHHVAVVLVDDGTPDVSEIQLYVDGLPQSVTVSSAQAINTVLASDVLIGAFDNAGTKGGYFNGLIDDVQIYNRALTATEIQAIVTP
jgi:hypothetical protein